MRGLGNAPASKTSAPQRVDPSHFGETSEVAIGARHRQTVLDGKSSEHSIGKCDSPWLGQRPDEPIGRGAVVRAQFIYRIEQDVGIDDVENIASVGDVKL